MTPSVSERLKALGDEAIHTCAEYSGPCAYCLELTAIRAEVEAVAADLRDGDCDLPGCYSDSLCASCNSKYCAADRLAKEEK